MASDSSTSKSRTRSSSTANTRRKSTHKKKEKIEVTKVTEVTLDSQDFYSEYHGHDSEDLQTLITFFRQNYPRKSLIFLAGDSSLDNKYWISGRFTRFLTEGNAVNGYEHILRPPISVKDVAYHLNSEALKRNMPFITVNCAVEESTLGSRIDNGKKNKTSLLRQDTIITKNIERDDVLIVSVGGNDIALAPTFSTIWNMAILNWFNSIESIKKGPDSAWGMPYFVDLFHNKLQSYIFKLLAGKRPKKILVCLIYFPDTKVTGSWADKTLGYLGYNDNPDKLQEVIRQIFKWAISQIKIDGTEVVPVPMYEVMDGSDTNDYVQRVEPSSQGGEKMAKLFLSKI